MSVATKNPFAILDDDTGLTPAPAPSKPEAPASAAPPRAAQKPKGGPASRGGKYYNRGGKPAQRDAGPTSEDAPAEKEKKSAEGRDSGRGRGRGRGRGDGTRGRGRQFDRHSATGKTDSDKKIHQSWGGDDGNTELKAEQAATTDANNDWAGGDSTPAADWAGADSGADWGATPPVDAAAADAGDKPEGRPRREREPEEDDNTLTLDQYLAQQKEKDSIVPKLEATRQANDGAGDDIWKGATVLSKAEEEEAYFVGKTKSAPKARPKKEEKVYLEIDARFDRPDRGGRGRGGRGGDRARATPRGAGRGGRGGRQTGPSSVNVDDQTAFPSLS